GIRTRAVLVKPSKLRRHAPPPRGVKILGFMQLDEYGVRSIAPAAQLIRKREKTARHRVSISAVDTGSLSFYRAEFRRAHGICMNALTRLGREPLAAEKRDASLYAIF